MNRKRRKYEIVSKKDGSLLISERERGEWYMKHNGEPVEFNVS